MLWQPPRVCHINMATFTFFHPKYGDFVNFFSSKNNPFLYFALEFFGHHGAKYLPKKKTPTSVNLFGEI